jgi:hypothetical protein
MPSRGVVSRPKHPRHPLNAHLFAANERLALRRPIAINAAAESRSKGVAFDVKTMRGTVDQAQNTILSPLKA